MKLFKELLKNDAPLICVGAGNFALKCQNQLIYNYPTLWERVKYFMDDNYKEITSIKKDVRPIGKDADDNAIYIIMTQYEDAEAFLYAKLQANGIREGKIAVAGKKVLPFLSILLKSTDKNINICELGSLGLSQPLTVFKRNVDLDRLRIHGFDPDAADCLKKNDTESYYTAYPCAVDAEDRESRPVYVVTDTKRIASHPPSEKNLQRYNLESRDEQFGNFGMTEIHNTISLNTWKKNNNIGDIDYMYINVDSAEYYVLQGADDILKDALVLEIETYFNPHYTGQPLYGEVDNIVRKHNYELLDFYIPNRIPPRHSPFDFGDTYLIHMNALYFKADIVEMNDIDKLLKMVAVLEIKDHKNLAFQLLHEAYQKALKESPADAERLKSIISEAYGLYAQKQTPVISLDSFLSPKA